MTNYNLDVNGRRYNLNEDFRAALVERAEAEYSENSRFSCWWSVAKKENYTEEAWENNIHEEGDPILTIETTGVMVPWERLDQLEAQMPGDDVMGEFMRDNHKDDDEAEDLDSGNGMASVDRDTKPDSKKEVFGRTHFSLLPHRFEDVPNAGGEDPEKIPPAPEELDEPSLVMWLPSHPDVEHTWGAGEAITSMDSWVEWNVQAKADQPRPAQEESDSHDAFESLCMIHDCEVVGEYEPSNEIPEGESGTVERKGKNSFENGRYGGGHWNI